MLYKSAAAVFVLASGADAFQAGALSGLTRAAVARPAVSMQVAEAEVASPVALAKVRNAPMRTRSGLHNLQRRPGRRARDPPPPFALALRDPPPEL
jgi:hypothetical protein